MSRAAIDFGIDLGTTNSAVAFRRGIEVTVVRNNEGDEYTPSVVWIDKNGRLFVGRQARERLESDPANAFGEFKRLMGKDQRYSFARSGRTMLPEELSAEVLKSLKSSVKLSTGEELQSAVITVPADFYSPESHATNRAAQLAGITVSPLLQEPVAAAWAYGFQNDEDDAFWLVYDIGGGTFDAAVIQVSDGLARVVEHGGDKHLGGKDVDWAIVNELLVPALTREHVLEDFRRANQRWGGAFAKLKLAAENAKIQASQAGSAWIRIDSLCRDERGEHVEFEHELKRQDVARLASPVVVRSINICKEVLTKARLDAGDIAKILLVGGPTLAPYLRETLADRSEGLGIPLEYRIDPLTVVARGAALFAGTQLLPPTRSAAPSDEFTISLPDWKPMGNEVRPRAAGKVSAPTEHDLSGLTIEFFNAAAHPPWRSGRIPVESRGGFMTRLRAEEGENTYSVELHDATGGAQEATIYPSALTYALTAGPEFENAPLTHSIGVALFTNEMQWLLEKGTPLPHRARVLLKTVDEVRQGQSEGAIRIPVMEGQNRLADRNRRIGTLEIRGDQIRWQRVKVLPARSEVEVLIEMDASRQMRVNAHIPVLDQEFEEVLDLRGAGEYDLAALTQEAEAELGRLEKARQDVRDLSDQQAALALQSIDDEATVRDIDGLIKASAADPDAADRLESRVLALRIAIDRIDEALEWPALVASTESLMASWADDVLQYGTPDQTQALATCELQIGTAIEAHDSDRLRQLANDLRRIKGSILGRVPHYHVDWFRYLHDRGLEMADQGRAQQLIVQGLRAREDNDLETLIAVNRELFELLPTPPPALPPHRSTVGR